MKLTVRLFARARDLAGREYLSLELSEPATVAELKKRLGEEVPELQSLVPSLLVAIGTDYAGPETRLAPEQEIACFPPVSGG